MANPFYDALTPGISLSSSFPFAVNCSLKDYFSAGTNIEYVMSKPGKLSVLHYWYKWFWVACVCGYFLSYISITRNKLHCNNTTEPCDHSNRNSKIYYKICTYTRLHLTPTYETCWGCLENKRLIVRKCKQKTTSPWCWQLAVT